MKESKKHVKTFRDFILWQKSHQLVKSVQTLVKHFQYRDVYSIAGRLKHSCASATAAIADAFERERVNDKIQILNVSRDLLIESQQHLIQVQELNKCNTRMALIESDQVLILLEAYISALKK